MRQLGRRWQWPDRVGHDAAADRPPRRVRPGHPGCLRTGRDRHQHGRRRRGRWNQPAAEAGGQGQQVRPDRGDLDRPLADHRRRRRPARLGHPAADRPVVRRRGARTDPGSGLPHAHPGVVDREPERLEVRLRRLHRRGRADRGQLPGVRPGADQQAGRPLHRHRGGRRGDGGSVEEPGTHVRVHDRLPRAVPRRDDRLQPVHPAGEGRRCRRHDRPGDPAGRSRALEADEVAGLRPADGVGGEGRQRRLPAGRRSAGRGCSGVRVLDPEQRQRRRAGAVRRQ